MSEQSKPPLDWGTQKPGGKRTSDLLVAVRERGILNAMMDYPVKQYEAAHPGWKCRWEYAPPNGDNMLVVGREAMGFKVVDASELTDTTESQQKSGPIRRGDMILMAGPAELAEGLVAEDARKAEEDLRMPETAYYDAVRRTKVQLSTGEQDSARPTGTIRSKIEEHSIKGGGE